MKDYRELIGEEFERWKVIDVSPKTGYVRCRCSCGAEKDVSVSSLKNKKTKGCLSCREQTHHDFVPSRKKDAERYIGREMFELKILNVRQSENKKGYEFQCLCSCGEIFWAKKSNVLYGTTRTCGHNTDENLNIGRKLTVEGTMIAAIDENRSLNKNSTTGHKGVSMMANGSYRAYITFQRKQYYLGTYTDIENAISARKEAEREIYGNFLDWYKANENKNNLVNVGDGNFWVSKKGEVYLDQNGFKKANIIYKDFIPSVSISKNNKQLSYYVKRLLAEAFLPNPEHKTMVCNLDNNSKNISLSNLQWVTQSELTAMHVVNRKRHCKKCNKLIKYQYENEDICEKCYNKRKKENENLEKEKRERIKEANSKLFSNLNLDKLTKKQQEVIEMKLKGYENSEIAKELNITRQYVFSILKLLIAKER